MLSNNIIAAIVITGIFLLIDIVLIILTVIETNKLSECTGKQSPYCPFMTCSSITDSKGSPLDKADFKYGYNSCSNFMYRKINPDGAATDSKNIECNLPAGTGDQSVQGPTAPN